MKARKIFPGEFSTALFELKQIEGSRYQFTFTPRGASLLRHSKANAVRNFETEDADFVALYSLVNDALLDALIDEETFPELDDDAPLLYWGA